MKYFILSIFILIHYSCKYDKLDIAADDGTGYPPEISAILVNKCATAGCHNEQSYANAAHLSFETWNKMFEGSSSGATVIPYRPDYSTLLFFTNTDSTQGTQLMPLMPYNMPPLSSQEYNTLKEWIANGAPDKNGFVKFSDNPSRPKLYISNQGVDEVAVMDVQSNLIIRYVHVGLASFVEVPHMIKVSPDNKYWYAVFYSGSVIQKFSTANNEQIAYANIGIGAWNTFAISPDSKRAFVVDFNGGQIAVVDLENMSVIDHWQGFDNPHGSALNKNADTLYVTEQFGNFIYKIPVNDYSNYVTVCLNPPAAVSTQSSLDPHEVAFNNDYSKYYVTCQTSNEVRVYKTSNDSLLKVISTPLFPVEMAFSHTKPYLFVTCLSTANAGSTVLGQVYVIDTNSDSIIKSINSGHQPHGIVVSDENNRVYVANRNASHGGPPSHHPINTIGNGYLVAIDLNTLDLIPGYKVELSIDSYSITLTH